MGSEIAQFALILGFFAVVAAAWLIVVYLPGRTMENGWRRDDETS